MVGVTVLERRSDEKRRPVLADLAGEHLDGRRNVGDRAPRHSSIGKAEEALRRSRQTQLAEREVELAAAPRGEPPSAGLADPPATLENPLRPWIVLAVGP